MIIKENLKLYSILQKIYIMEIKKKENREWEIGEILR